MLLQVHDELVFEVPEDEVEPTADLIRDVMAQAAHLDVPLVVDVGCGAELGRRALTGRRVAHGDERLARLMGTILSAITAKMIAGGLTEVFRQLRPGD